MTEKDVRYHRTRSTIINAMIRLLKKKKFDQISVKSICEEAKISRSGFYLHYVDKYDLVETYLLDFLIFANQMIQTADAMNTKKLMLLMMNYLKNDGQLIALLLSNNGSIEVQNKMKSILQENAKKNIIPYLNLTINTPIKERYMLGFLSNAIFGVLQEWINYGQQEKPEEIVEIMNRLIFYDFKNENS